MKKIFVSSTFKDMQFERDHLHSRIVPLLDAQAAAYGESVSLVDLRWGVDTTDLDSAEGARKVLSVCIDEIDRCKPYMIIILGDRYGWIPDQEITRSYMDDMELMEKSVTELEIIHGVFRNSGGGKALFYFRRMEGDGIPAEFLAEDALHAQKLNALKERIRALPNASVSEYTVKWDKEHNTPVGIETFGELVLRDVAAAMREEWQSNLLLSPWEKCGILQNNIAAEKAQNAVRRDSVVGQIEKSRKEHHAVLLYGAGGYGKSVIAAQWARRREEEGDRVLRFFCGTLPMLSSAEGLIRGMIWQMERFLGMEPSDADALDDEAFTQLLAQRAAQYAQQEAPPLSILIDGVDQLAETPLMARYGFIPPNLSGRVSMLITTNTMYQPPLFLPVIPLGPLSGEEKTAIIQSLLRAASKQMDDRIIQEIARRPVSENPLGLSLLIQRFLMMSRQDYDRIRAGGDDMAAIYAFQKELLSELPNQAPTLMMRLISQARENLGFSWISLACVYIGISRSGLRYSDLAAILGKKFNQLDFSVFIHYLKGCFLVREDGCYDFSHGILKMGIRRLFIEDDGHKLYCYQSVARHLLSLPASDPLRQSEFLWFAYDAQINTEAVRFLADLAGAEPSAVRASAHSLRDACARRDARAWFCQALEDCAADAQFPPRTLFRALEFLVHGFADNLSGSISDQIILKKFLRTVCGILSHSEENRLSGTDCALLYAQACIKEAECRIISKTEASSEREEELLTTAQALLEERGRGEERILRIRCGRLLAGVYARRGLWEKALDTLSAMRGVIREYCGPYDYETASFAKTDIVTANRLYADYFLTSAELRLAQNTGQSLLEGVSTISLYLHDLEDIEDRELLLDERMRALKLHAKLLLASGDPPMGLLARRQLLTLVQLCEDRLKKENDAGVMAHLADAFELLFEAACEKGDAASVSEAAGYGLRSIHMHIQRAGFLGTPEALIPLASSCIKMAGLYREHGTQEDLDQAGQLLSVAGSILKGAVTRFRDPRLISLLVSLEVTHAELSFLQYGKDWIPQVNEAIQVVNRYLDKAELSPSGKLNTRVRLEKLRIAAGGVNVSSARDNLQGMLDAAADASESDQAKLRLLLADLLWQMDGEENAAQAAAHLKTVLDLPLPARERLDAYQLLLRTAVQAPDKTGLSQQETMDLCGRALDCVWEELSHRNSPEYYVLLCDFLQAETRLHLRGACPQNAMDPARQAVECAALILERHISEKSFERVAECCRLRAEAARQNGAYREAVYACDMRMDYVRRLFSLYPGVRSFHTFGDTAAEVSGFFFDLYAQGGGSAAAYGLNEGHAERVLIDCHTRLGKFVEDRADDLEANQHIAAIFSRLALTLSERHVSALWMLWVPDMVQNAAVCCRRFVTRLDDPDQISASLRDIKPLLDLLAGMSKTVRDEDFRAAGVGKKAVRDFRVAVLVNFARICTLFSEYVKVPEARLSNYREAARAYHILWHDYDETYQSDWSGAVYKCYEYLKEYSGSPAAAVKAIHACGYEPAYHKDMIGNIEFAYRTAKQLYQDDPSQYRDLFRNALNDMIAACSTTEKLFIHSKQYKALKEELRSL